MIYASHEMISSFAFRVKHKKIKKIKNDEPELKIIVGLGFTGCRGWSAKYGEQTT